MSTLSKMEMAALTARVPCSGNSHIDGIITLSLRFQMSGEMMKSLIEVWPGMEKEKVARLAIQYTDALLNQFDKERVAK